MSSKQHQQLTRDMINFTEIIGCKCIGDFAKDLKKNKHHVMFNHSKKEELIIRNSHRTQKCINDSIMRNNMIKFTIYAYWSTKNICNNFLSLSDKDHIIETLLNDITKLDFKNVTFDKENKECSQNMFDLQTKLKNNKKNNAIEDL